MSEFQATFEVFSPRWGHTDRYRVSFKQQEMQIAAGATKVAICKLGENGEPEWSGHSGSHGNSLMNIFSEDEIYAPEIVPFALEWAWGRWREGAIEAEALRSGLRELFGWIDQTARSKPKEAIWEGAF